MSKLTQEDVRSIRTINYSPSVKTSKEQIPCGSPKNKHIKKTLNAFKVLHQEEVSNLSQKMSQHQSSKDVTSVMRINLISAESPSKPQNRRNSNSLYSRSFRNSHVSVEAPKSSFNNQGQNFLLVDSNKNRKQFVDI